MGGVGRGGWAPLCSSSTPRVGLPFVEFGVMSYVSVVPRRCSSSLRWLATIYLLLLVLLWLKPMEGVVLVPLLLNKLDLPPFELNTVDEIPELGPLVFRSRCGGCEAALGSELPLDLIWWCKGGSSRFHLVGKKRISSLSRLAGRGGRGEAQWCGVVACSPSSGRPWRRGDEGDNRCF